jgi:bacterioferritin-associated ferredoxin
MIVCSCRAVNERTIAAAIDAGAATCHDIIRSCGAGSKCGSCVTTIAQLLVRLRDGAGAIAVPAA